MMEDRYSPEHQKTTPGKRPEARYAYYPRCQVFRKGGEQCKAPAEKGSQICHAHAGQLAMAVRRERERRAVLEEAVAQMRKRGRPDCEMADLFMDFKGINMTLAVMAQAVITGRIDCKTAGRLVVQLQTISKLLWTIHRKGREGRKENGILPQIYADDRGLNRPGKEAHLTAARRDGEKQKSLPLMNTDNNDLRKGKAHRNTEARRRGERPRTADHFPPNCLATNHFVARGRAANHWAANEHEETQIALAAKVRALAERRGWGHAPPELLRAA